MLNKLCFLLVTVALVTVTLTTADLPINCMYSDVIGTWKISESSRDKISTEKCTDVSEPAHTKEFTFVFPDQVVDELGNRGTWTLIYNQGFEFNINERSYYANFEYDQKSRTFYCDRLHTGWCRDETVRHWSCFSGQKQQPSQFQQGPRKFVRFSSPFQQRKYVNDFAFIRSINAVQNSWTAKAYTEHEKYTVGEMLQRGGGTYSPLPPTVPASDELKARVVLLPKDFDWRDVDGVNYVSPVRDQASCGSCYSFAAMGLLESRVRIATKNARQDIFSIQDPVSCTELAQGCAGGFSYLIGGRYAMDQGVVEESCNIYTALDSPCETDLECKRTYVSEYSYVGGYYGGCNEELMMEALLGKGPLAVSFYVESDFYAYTGGIYHHVENIRGDFNPLYVVSHAVLLVGYGEDPTTGEKFWSVKNSWGKYFGEEGYFRIRRGTNEVGIESGAFDSTIIP